MIKQKFTAIILKHYSHYYFTPNIEFNISFTLRNILLLGKMRIIKQHVSQEMLSLQKNLIQTLCI